MSEISLELKNIKKSFQEGEDVLESICLTAKKGEFVTLLGSSGCGKTTTVQMLGEILSREYGKKVLCIDTDPQCNLTTVSGVNLMESQ